MNKKLDWLASTAGITVGLALYGVSRVLKGAVDLYNKVAEVFAIPPL